MRTCTRLALAALVIAGSQIAHAETTARQSFLVNIPRRLTIAAPPVAAQAEMDQDAVQVALPSQLWTVASNARDGATVRLSTLQSFHNLADDTIRRDAELEVRIQNQTESGAWSVSTSSATTDHLRGQEEASVELRSTGPGTAEIRLNVTMRSSEDQFTPSGDYVTTVVGTITAN